MKDSRLIMGMPVTVEVVDSSVADNHLETVFDYFTYIDKTFSVYKKTSEISQINDGFIAESDYSSDMREVFELSAQTYSETNGYFNIKIHGRYDPSGLVKGWAIYNAAQLIKKMGFKDFYIDAGGDIQTSGHNRFGENWTVGIRNPFNTGEVIKTIRIRNEGVATSGTYIRGQHIWNPFQTDQPIEDIVSLTVVGPNIYEADRFATAAYAMGKKGIFFIEKCPGLEGYMIDYKGIATFTSGFEKYISHND